MAKEVKLVNKFQGRCSHCGELISRGTTVLWNPETKTIRHRIDCQILVRKETPISIVRGENIHDEWTLKIWAVACEYWEGVKYMVTMEGWNINNHTAFSGLKTRIGQGREQLFFESHTFDTLEEANEMFDAGLLDMPILQQMYEHGQLRWQQQQG